jgi:hypothetical protein
LIGGGRRLAVENATTQRKLERVPIPPKLNAL